MAVTISGSGPVTGVTTLASPTTINGLTLPTTGFGKILQVVRATDTTLRSTTSATAVDANISVTITPQKSTSAILVLWLANSDPANGQYMYLVITDSSNNALSGAEAISFGSAASSMRTLLSGIGYSTPATTAATTYKGRFYTGAAAQAAQLFNDENTGQLYAIEVSA